MGYIAGGLKLRFERLGNLYVAVEPPYHVHNQHPSSYKQNKSRGKERKTNFSILAWEYEAPTTVLFCSWGLDPELFFQKGEPVRLFEDKTPISTQEQPKQTEHETQTHTQNGLSIPTDCHRPLYQPLHQERGINPESKRGEVRTNLDHFLQHWLALSSPQHLQPSPSLDQTYLLLALLRRHCAQAGQS